jgi:hypothetical protein
MEVEIVYKELNQNTKTRLQTGGFFFAPALLDLRKNLKTENGFLL